MIDKSLGGKGRPGWVPYQLFQPGLLNFELQVMSCELRVMSYELRVTCFQTMIFCPIFHSWHDLLRKLNEGS